MSKSLKTVLLLFFTLFIVMGFQNCLQQDSATNDNSASSSQNQNGSPATLEGNGGGYVGKATFLHIDLDGVCSTVGGVKQKIVINDQDESFLTVQDCQQIVPQKVELDSLALLPHNQSLLLDSTDIYQSAELPLGDEFTRFVCRGEQAQNNSPTPGERVVDFQIHQDLADGGYLMDAIIGIYSVGNTSFVTDQLDKKVALRSETSELIVFESERTASDYFDLLDMNFPLPGLGNAIAVDKVFLEINKSTMRGRSYTQSMSGAGSARTLAEGLFCFQQ